MSVAGQFARVVMIDLREERVQKPATALAWSFNQLQVVRPEEHDTKRPDHVARPAGDAVDSEFARRPRSGSDGTQVDAHLQLLEAGVGLDAAGDTGGRLTETHQLGGLLRARGAGQGRERDGLEQVGLPLRVAAEEDGGGALQRQVQFRVIAKVEQ